MDIPIIFVSKDTFREHAAVGIHVNFGSADENTSQWGLAHLLEHVLVRTHFPKLLHLKATTGRERTSFQLIVKNNQVNRVIEQLATLIYRRVEITAKVLGEEKGIVAREIAERHQNKSWRVREATFSALWGGTPYSRDPLGSVAVWGSIDTSPLMRILEQQYIVENAILIIAGHPSLEDQLVSTNRPLPLSRVTPMAILPQNPRRLRLNWGREELGEVIAWKDTEAGSRVRLVNKFGKARFQQLSLRQGWLTWVWVPPDANPLSTIEDQLTAVRSALAGPENELMCEYKLAEMKRTDQVEAAAKDALDFLWTDLPLTSPHSLAEDLDLWSTLVHESRA